MCNCGIVIDMHYPGVKFRRYTIRTAIYIALIVGTVIFLLPIFVVLNTSFKNPATITLATTWRLPDQIYWQSYAEAIDKFGPRIWNSITLVTNSTILSAVIGSLNGYVLSKWRITGERILFPLILLGMFIPYQAILIPLFEFMRDVRLYGGIPGLIIIHTIYGLPITTLIFRNFYVDIPDEMLEAA